MATTAAATTHLANGDHDPADLPVTVVPLSDLRPHPQNYRAHPDEQIAHLMASLREHGLYRNIVTARDGTILAGHGVAIAAERLGYTAVPIRRLDLDPLEPAALKVLAGDNELSRLAIDDDAALAAVLRQIGDDDVSHLLGTGYDEAAVLALLASLEPTPTVGLTDPDDVPPLPAEPITKPGDLWLLGRHRLLCGDATVVTDVDYLLGGAMPALMVTDPPYGVEYDPEWRVDRGRNERTHGAKMMNDDRSDWNEAWSLFPGDVAYLWHASAKTDVVAESLRMCGFDLAYLIVWNKDLANFNRGNYHYKHELCWYAVKDGRERHWIGDEKQTTVWDIPTIHSFANGHSVEEWGMVGHAAQKPVECMSRPMKNHTGDVYDPFVGSGSTIIAAEECGRSCYAMDIDPKHVDTAVSRWERFTGQTATLAVTALAAD